MQILFEILIVILVTYHLLNSFKIYQRILIMIVLSVLIGFASYRLTMYGIGLYDKFHDVGNAGIFIGAIIMFPLISEAILLPIFSYIINRYNVGKIGIVKFVINIVLVVLIFTIFNIVIYL